MVSAIEGSSMPERNAAARHMELSRLQACMQIAGECPNERLPLRELNVCVHDSGTACGILRTPCMAMLLSVQAVSMHSGGLFCSICAFPRLLKRGTLKTIKRNL